MSDKVVKRSVRISGHPTSVSIEAPFWTALRDIAFARGISLNALVATIAARRERSPGSPFPWADIAIAGYLYYPEPYTFDRKDYPHIDRWLDRIAAQPGWKHPYDLMPGNPSDRA